MNNEKTRSKTYLLPSLVHQYNLNTTEIKGLFLGIDTVTKNTNNSVYLWVNKDDEFKNYIAKYTYDKDILLEYEFKDKVLFNKFIGGKYSEFSDLKKQKIIEFYNLKNNHKVSQVLYKSPTLRLEMERKLKMSLKGYELGEKINYAEECYNPELSRD